MTTRTQNKAKITVDGVGYSVETIAELTGLSEKTVQATPKAALEAMVKTELDKRAAQSKASSGGTRKAKETARQKFCKKADSKMGAGAEKLVDYVVNGTRYDKDTDYSTTDQYMADRYGPVVLSVLYKYGCLSQFMQDRIEALYPDS